jgi:pimeloyl-ACP methyl ester carboxylesterase
MGYVTTKDGVQIFYKDWGPRDAQVIFFHHGWPLSADDWDAQMISYRLSTHVRGFGAGLYAGSGIGWLRRDWRTSSGTLNCAATIRLPSWTEIELPS